MSGTLEIDEGAVTAAGPVTISTGALTFTYDKNDMGALALAPTNAGDGEDDNYGDYSVAFSSWWHRCNIHKRPRVKRQRDGCYLLSWCIVTCH